MPLIETRNYAKLIMLRETWIRSLPVLFLRLLLGSPSSDTYEHVEVELTVAESSFASQDPLLQGRHLQHSVAAQPLSLEELSSQGCRQLQESQEPTTQHYL